MLTMLFLAFSAGCNPQYAQKTLKLKNCKQQKELNNDIINCKKTQKNHTISNVLKRYFSPMTSAEENNE